MRSWSEMSAMSPADWQGVEDRALARDEQRWQDDHDEHPAQPERRERHALAIRHGHVDPFSYDFEQGYRVVCLCGWGRPAHQRQADAEAEKRALTGCPYDERSSSEAESH